MSRKKQDDQTAGWQEVIRRSGEEARDREDHRKKAAATLLRNVSQLSLAGQVTALLLGYEKGTLTINDFLNGLGKQVNYPRRFGEEPAEVTIDQPVGNCDGSGMYAYDPSTEDCRGAKLATPCPGCRACK